MFSFSGCKPVLLKPFLIFDGEKASKKAHQTNLATS